MTVKRQCPLKKNLSLESENIVHTHFNSHVLNPSKAASCKMPSMRNMIDDVNEILSLFFGYSPKRQRRLLINVRLP